VEVALVYPDDADDGAGRLSVCAGMGTAILGYRAGDAFHWRLAGRTRHIRIGKVLYQPEAAGHFHL
jgi:regulator of nucleoside diphosphate kinase